MLKAVCSDLPGVKERSIFLRWFLIFLPFHATLYSRVRFVSDTINTGGIFTNLNVHLGTPASEFPERYLRIGGASFWGVWGALGTIDGGESVPL